MHNNKFNIIWPLFIGFYLLVHLFFIPQAWGQQAISDSGYISYITVIFLFASLIFTLKASTNDFYKKYKIDIYILAYCLLIYVLREADFHRLFTDEHVTRMKFFMNPEINLQQKIIGGTPVILFFICAIYLIVKYSKLIFTHLLRTTPWAIAVFMWGLIFILSQAMDKSDLNDIYQGRAAEEIMEMCASGYLLLAIIQSFFPSMLLFRRKNH